MRHAPPRPDDLFKQPFKVLQVRLVNEKEALVELECYSVEFEFLYSCDKQMFVMSDHRGEWLAWAAGEIWQAGAAICRAEQEVARLLGLGSAHKK